MAEDLGWAVTLENIAFPVEVVASAPRLDSKLSDDELDLTEALQSVKTRCRSLGLTENEINDTNYKVELVVWAYGPEISKAIQKEFAVDTDPET